jgi:hypothetical protein
MVVPSAASSARLKSHPFPQRRILKRLPRPRRSRAISSWECVIDLRRSNGAGLARDAEATFVAIVSVVVAVLVPFGVTVVGEKAQVLKAGNPEHAKLTAWLKPFTGATLTVVVPGVPGLTVSVLGLKETVKLGASTVCVRMLDVEPAKFESPA